VLTTAESAAWREPVLLAFATAVEMSDPAVVITAASADVRAESDVIADSAAHLYAAAVELSDPAVVTTAASADVRAATSTMEFAAPLWRAFRANGPGSFSPAQRAGLRRS
jgi:hypothetical protein